MGVCLRASKTLRYIKNNKANSAFNPHVVGKLSTGLPAEDRVFGG